ncbi:uncharacterized protein [Lepeophtheirus salmonis]|uniref:uncharacterized protein isoform X2 n=1 Tax=Lepeophtheirus salmonis TaxID=72036 RepID=UPI001AEA5833|nr:uncharacterized protein LOC121123172 isoform X2 [Lepeophtheirus salmonis]
MAQFESKKQIVFLFIGAFVLSVITIAFINAEAKRRFGADQREDNNEKDPSYLSRFKERIRGQLLTWLQPDEKANYVQKRKLLSFDEKPYLGPPMSGFSDEADYSEKKHADYNRILKLQSEIIKRLGGDKKLIFDILGAFCSCKNEEKGNSEIQDQMKKPDAEIQDQMKKPDAAIRTQESTDSNYTELNRNSTLDFFKKVLTNLDYSEKIIKSFDYCAVQGLIYVVVAIILTSLLNYTLVFCCYFWCLRGRGSKFGIKKKKDKMDYMDHDFTETENFLPPLEEKKEEGGPA